MRLSRLFPALLLSSLAVFACSSPANPDALGSVEQAQDNPPNTSEPDRCSAMRDSNGEYLGEGTIDQNGMCCVPQGDGSKTCYGCGDGFTCTSIPSTIKPPRKPPTFLPPPGLPVKR
jgi:hypothetical protein